MTAAALPDGRYLVLGLGRAGTAVAEYLAGAAADGAGIDVFGVDEADTETLRERAAGLRASGVEVALGAEGVEGEFVLAVASPGIPPSSRLLQSVAETGTKIVSDVELAFRVSTVPMAAVTGTNGKTTVTSLLAHLLSESGVPARAMGNIGTPVIATAPDMGEDEVAVVEVSSFQLERIDRFRPRVAVLLNVTPDHLDWHGSFDAYARAKARVFENQGEGDLAAVCVDDPVASAIARDVQDRGVSVSRIGLASVSRGGADASGGVLTLRKGGDLPLLPVAELGIKGDHNVLNALAAARAAIALGAPAEGVRAGLRSFRPLEHRLEPVPAKDDVEYVNDSKATNPDAVAKALTAFRGRRIVLLLGGKNKGARFEPLRDPVTEACRALVLFGEAAEEIEADLAGVGVRTVRVGRLADGVRAARELAEAGDVVLLSPACASFDEFGSYEERGRAFKEEVADLVRGREGVTR